MLNIKKYKVVRYHAVLIYFAEYGFGTAAVAIISALAFVGMVFFPMIRSEKFKLVMQFFVALGVGAMSGDAIFHIIPNVSIFASLI